MKIRASKILGHILGSMEFSMGASAYACVDSSWECPEVSFPFNRLYLVKSGSALLRCGGKEYEMKPGMAYLLPAGLPCAYCCRDKMEKLYFHFNYFCPDRYDIFWGSGQIGCLPMPEGLWDMMYRAIGGTNVLAALTGQQGILTMATAFMKEMGMGRGSVAGYSEVVLDTIGYIRENLSARLRLEQLAQRCFVSRNHLSEVFRRETGISLGRYIDEQLMLEAQRRLTQTEETIGTISRELGFCDQFYFSRRFVQLCGITPQLYRKSIK